MGMWSILLTATLMALFLDFGEVLAFEGQIQRMLLYSENHLDRTPVREGLQPILESKKTVIVPLLENKVFVNEYEDGDVVEPLYLSGRTNGLDEGDGNRYMYLGVDFYGTRYAAVEFKDMDAFKSFTGGQRREDGGTLTQRSLREVSEKIPDFEAVSILAQAVGLNTWHLRTKFCSRCGTSVKSERAGAVLRCQNDNCKASSYPRIEPATMNFITDESNQYTLLGRKANWPQGRYSCLAGFLEVGETLEQCVIRETREESGVIVDEESIVYTGSQPWPFPSSLMIGYRGIACRSEGQARNELPLIDFDEKEMEDVNWFSKREVREALKACQEREGERVSTSALDKEAEPASSFDREKGTFLHFPGFSSMARVMLREWALEEE